MLLWWFLQAIKIPNIAEKICKTQVNGKEAVPKMLIHVHVYNKGYCFIKFMYKYFLTCGHMHEC